jgi:PAS domain S-box-containing protein
MSDLLTDPAQRDALTRTGLMDSGPEGVFDRLTQLASKLLDAPVAAISLVDGTRQYFKSSFGMDVHQTPLSQSFCRRVVTDEAPLIVADARRDSRVQDGVAIGDLDAVAYCGVPLTDGDGHTLGAFCAIDTSPRQWTAGEVEILEELAYNLMTELELRAANMALTVREQETRAIIDRAHDAFVATDADGRVLDWNPAAERLFGWRRDEAVGRLASETILPPDADADPDLDGAHSRAPGLGRYARFPVPNVPDLPVEVRAVHRSGRQLLVEMTVALVDSPGGARFNALIRDIADRRAAELEREQLAQVVASTRDAVITVDLNGIITSWNAGAERLYGYSAEEMIGRCQTPLNASGPECTDAEGLMPRLLAGEHVTVRALPRRNRSGQPIYVDLSAAPLRDREGRVVGSTSIARDVTDHHRLELTLAESEARFRETFDEAPIGVALIGPNGRWLEVNRALCEILGYSEAELLALTFQQITHPDDLDRDLDLLGKVLSGDLPTYQLEKRYFHRDGHSIWTKLSVALVTDEAGAPLHFVSHIEDITHAKATESALREGRRLLDESQSVAGVGSWSWNLETGESSWSVQQFLLHGANPLQDAPSLERFLELVHPEDRERLGASIAANMAGRRPFADQYRLALPASRGRTLAIRGDFLAADPSCGLHDRMAGTTQDVTAERTAQAARQESENRQRVLLSSLPDTMIVLYDRDLCCTLLQGALLEQIGITPSQFVGRPLSAMVPADRFDGLERLVTRALEGEPGSLEYPTGTGLTYQVDFAPYRSDDGEITGAFTVWRDITDRLERERQTRMLATIVEQSEDAILAKSPNGVITEWNRGAELLYGYTAQEAIGQPINLLIPAERGEEGRELLARVMSGAAVPQLETVRVHKDGREIPVSISISPLYGDNESTIVGASVVARNMTERKLMDDELRASREQALEASRLKSEFVANMSHEIRTPLNGVVSMAELLLGTALSPEQSQYAQVAMTSAESLMRVINDILDFSKIEAGKLEILSEDFSVRAAVDEVVEILGIKAAAGGLKLTVSISGEVAPAVRGDGNRVRQVLMNLLSNAVKFTPDGEITVGVRITAGAHGAQRLHVDVRDTGIGVDAERLPSLFEAFSQGDATTTRRYGGTGLGLCISKQLVELMGGEIGCDSEPGRGSRFWFELPYLPGDGFETVLDRSDLTGTRVLIVDDVATDRQAMESRLASWGIKPDSAGDGPSALRLLRAAAEAGRPFETALIDRGMPGIDGLELARQIKGIPALRSTRLIMVSAAAVDPDEADAAGIHAQLLKPVRPSRLYNQLLSTLHKERAGPVALTTGAPAAPVVITDASRVLVAEDNEVNQFAAICLLQRFGFNVDVASNGREAVAMTGRFDYAAVFMDCQMPEVDGYTATEMIRGRESGTGAHTPIVALTAHALGGDREKCLAAGMDDYVAKPLRMETIEALIQRIPALQPDAGPATTEADLRFDPTNLDELGDPEVGAQLAQMFLDGAAKRITALEEAIAASDTGRVHALAHALKGSSATVGAMRISELSRTLCELSDADITAEGADVHAELAVALEQTGVELARYIDGLALARYVDGLAVASLT